MGIAWMAALPGNGRLQVLKSSSWMSVSYKRTNGYARVNGRMRLRGHSAEVEMQGFYAEKLRFSALLSIG